MIYFNNITSPVTGREIKMIKKEEFIDRMSFCFDTSNITATKILPKMIRIKIISNEFKGVSLDRRWLMVLNVIKREFPELHKNYYFSMDGLYAPDEV
jgi:stress-induced morphogen